MLCQTGSVAMRRYTMRAAVAMTLYIAILLVADIAIRRYAPTGPLLYLLYLLAVLPALPVIAVFVALGRYLIEETDEYQRALMVRQIVYATGLTLVVATIWGFLSALAEIAPLRHVAVLWFASFGLAAIVIRIQQG